MTKRINNYTKILKFYFENNGVGVSENEIEKIIVSLKHLGVYNFYSEEDYCYYYLIKTNGRSKCLDRHKYILISEIECSTPQKLVTVGKMFSPKPTERQSPALRFLLFPSASLESCLRDY